LQSIIEAIRCKKIEKSLNTYAQKLIRNTVNNIVSANIIRNFCYGKKRMLCIVHSIISGLIVEKKRIGQK